MKSKARIFVVDDDPSNRTIFQEILSESYEVHGFASGRECLESAGRLMPDLVLLDVMMPVLDGYETCRKLRAIPDLSQIKIIMISARRRVEDRLKGYESGADDYITKPINREEFLAKIGVYTRLKRVEEMDRLKSDFIALLSHETRTPLGDIILPVKMVLESEGRMAPSAQREFLEMALRSAERLHMFMERMLDFSAMKAGKWTYRFAWEDMGRLAEMARDEVVSFAKERDVSVSVIRKWPAHCLVDGRCLKSVIRDIIHNAVRFSPDGGKVEVIVEPGEGNGVLLRIEDRGDGIEPELLPHVFKPFTCHDIDHHEAGHGLSLAVARQVVHDHGGTLEIRSCKGRGTTVIIRLPHETWREVEGGSAERLPVK